MPDQVWARDRFVAKGRAALSLAAGELEAWPLAPKGELQGVWRGPDGLLWIATGEREAAERELRVVDPRTGKARRGALRANGTITRIVFDAGRDRAVLLGEFTRVQGEERWHLAVLSASERKLTPLALPIDRPLSAAAFVDEELWLAGDFAWIGAQRLGPLAVLSLQTGELRPAGPAIAGGGVHALCATERWLVIGGRFESVDGQPRAGAAALDRATGALTSFDPQLSVGEPDGRPELRHLAVWGGALWLQGSFEAAGGHERRGLAAFALPGGELVDWAPPAAADASGFPLLADGSRAVLPFGLDPRSAGGCGLIRLDAC
jgi:hypothetical protein